MTVHKLSAGDGYTYLTRQVASADVARGRGQGLADYYTASGNPPGRWMGSGIAALGVAGLVSEAQMKALFGAGLHPDADRIRAEQEAAGASPEDVHAAVQLGRPFAAFSAESGRQAVAGYDLVFTPVKSASVLWALGTPATRAAVEAAHREAVADVLGWLERHAAFTRTGRGGIAQIDTRGLVAAAFEHRDSRLGDPNLHTHVAVSNKVQGVDGTWRAVDGTALFHAGVAASERYNTRFEDALARRLAVVFEPREAGRGKRPVREIAGVDPRLVAHFSARRAEIESAYAALAEGYRAEHGHAPSKAVQMRLAQQATLDTREAKKAPTTFGEQLAAWRRSAEALVGTNGVAAAEHDVLHRAASASAAPEPDVAALAASVVSVVEAERSTWSRWHVVAEAERQTRAIRCTTPADRDGLVEAVVTAALKGTGSVAIRAPQLVADPPALRRASDGCSVFTRHAEERYTSERILAAEQRLLAAAASTDAAPPADHGLVRLIAGDLERRLGQPLDAGQRALADAFACEGRQLLVGIGPAGSGKTTACRIVADAVAASGHRVIPLASSAKAAEVLGAELGLRAENLHKFLYEAERLSSGATPRTGPDSDFYRLRRGDVLLVDEAGMAGTLILDRLVGHAAAAGACVRLLGDPAQLSAVESGGALRLIAREAGAVELTALHRFTDPAEAEATLRLRTGDPAAISHYATNHRIHSGTRAEMVEAAYTGWATDMRAGKTSVLIAAAGDDVTALSARARADRIAAGQVEPDGVTLHDGSTAGVGDWVVTRANARLLPVRGCRDWVKNGDTWTVASRHGDGSLTLTHHAHGGRVRLPADYVARDVELGYAATVHRAQGITVDTAHPLITAEMSREALYVATTRGRDATTLYVATDELVDPELDRAPAPQRTALSVLTDVLGRESAERSATETIRDTLREAEGLATLVAAYEHAARLALATVPPGVDGSETAHPESPLPWLTAIVQDLEPAWRTYLDSRRTLITDRVRELADLVAARPPGWAFYLGSPPTHPNRRQQWWADVGLVAAYREQHQITDADPRRPLGVRPVPGSRQELAWTSARQALARLSRGRAAEEAHQSGGRTPQEAIRELRRLRAAHDDPRERRAAAAPGRQHLSALQRSR